ncbi:hypothetical protein ED28_14850 [[Pantoea] beijingensis]|uniref:Glycosyltransferase 2-like domain-containing protein n=1 Tax=[Pantoea] beijingensis TaxID=1324864 RepID=A0A443IBB5_9GAMM|nr:hypothetical protein [[Pantoea] beijingensis]RWR01197.1 hypothetical protein ED28_14850 [[Pantoea] beijingensis]
MRIVIGISTMNDGILLLLPKIKNLSDKFDVIICHQVTNKEEYKYNFLEAESSIRIVVKYEKGLSRSRNILLMTAIESGYDYLIVSDDDVEYCLEGLEFLQSLLIKNKTNEHFQIMSVTKEGMPRKKYRNRDFYLDGLDVFKVSSIEMCLNLTLIKEANISFDNNFGLGALYPVGEEAVLLCDIKKAGQDIKFVPVAVTIHPIESTGLLLYSNPDMVMSRGALFRRCFNTFQGFFMLLLFWAKKFCLPTSYKKNISAGNALTLMIKGYVGCGKP